MMTAMMLAFIRAIEGEKLSAREMDKIIYEFPKKYFDYLPHITRWIACHFMFSRLWKAKVKSIRK
ncbi:MAG TPA: hypothetical protein ENI33_00010 [Thermoplasmatales archaeon]|nr:hypothetical protein [Thermoplasmatales archaeon]